MIGKNKSIDFCNIDLNVQLVLHNSILFKNFFASNNKSNAFISRNVNNFKIINGTLLDIKIFNLIQINIKTQFARKMQLKSNLKIVSIFSAKTYFNSANTLTLNN